MRQDDRTMQIKVYIVLQRNNVARDGEPNERIIATRLTRSAAQGIVDIHPGTRIEKHLATK
jgi:hypothetical protein